MTDSSGGRKLDITLHQMFDLICELNYDGSHREIAKLVGDYTDIEIYAYLNGRTVTGVVSCEESVTILTKLDSFRADYIRA